MAIDPHILKALAAAGATSEMIIAAVAADAELQELKRAEGRRKAAARQRKSRESRNVTHNSRDIMGQSVTSSLPDKERSPTPPKEINPPSSFSDKSSNDSPETGVLLFPEIDSLEPKARARSSNDRELILDIVDLWNSEAQRLGLPMVQNIDPDRQRLIRARVKDLSDYGFTEPIEGIRAMLSKIADSDFLTGQKTSFRANFDFAFSKSKFKNIMEGSYEAKKQQNGFARH